MPASLAHLPAARIKRILANRESAARSKQRKLDYMMELENQVRGVQGHCLVADREFDLAFDHPRGVCGPLSLTPSNQMSVLHVFVLAPHGRSASTARRECTILR